MSRSVGVRIAFRSQPQMTHNDYLTQTQWYCVRTMNGIIEHESKALFMCHFVLEDTREERESVAELPLLFCQRKISRLVESLSISN